MNNEINYGKLDVVPYNYQYLKVTNLSSGQFETDVMKVGVVTTDLHCQGNGVFSKGVNALSLGVRDRLTTPLKLMSGNSALTNYNNGILEYSLCKCEYTLLDRVLMIDIGLNTHINEKTKCVKSALLRGLQFKPNRSYCYLLPYSTMTETGICRLLFLSHGSPDFPCGSFQVTFEKEIEGDIYIGNSIITLFI
jgi:hypothetical protein